MQISNNTVVNDEGGRGTFVYNFTRTPVNVTNNTVYDLTASQVTSGPANASGNTITTTRPSLDTSSPVSYGGQPSPSPSPSPSPAPSPQVDDTLVLHLSEDAYRGNAQFIAKVDGHQLGSAQSVTASHASGGDQAFTDAGLVLDQECLQCQVPPAVRAVRAILTAGARGADQPTCTWMRRGLASSALGIVRRSTPSRSCASMRCVSSSRLSVNCRR